MEKGIARQMTDQVMNGGCIMIDKVVGDDVYMCQQPARWIHKTLGFTYCDDHLAAYVEKADDANISCDFERIDDEDM